MDETNCWQFIVDYYRDELGIFLWSYEGKLKGREDKEKLAAFLDNYLNQSGHWEKVDVPIYPDIAMFDIKGLMIHGGIVLDHNRLLHMRVSGSIIESYKDRSLWKKSRKFKSLKGFYRKDSI